jgi:hypothetical protein
VPENAGFGVRFGLGVCVCDHEVSHCITMMVSVRLYMCMYSLDQSPETTLIP